MLYKRKFPNPIKPDGGGKATKVPINGGSSLYIGETAPMHSQLRICFHHNDTTELMWWVSRSGLSDLIAQLLYLKQDMDEAFGTEPRIKVDHFEDDDVMEEGEEEDNPEEPPF